jgi:hypothetical protein
MEAIPFAGLDEFLSLSDQSDAECEYTVAWLDVYSRAQRGIFFRGNHADGAIHAPRLRAAVPLDVPLVNGFTVRAFNAAYYAAQKLGGRSRLQHWDPFFFPLDGVGRWNRLYGRRGFLQFQCVVPTPEALRELLRDAPASPLTVLKRFGAVPSPGLLSFPRPGFTLALDLPNQGEETFAQFARLEAIAMEAGGATSFCWWRAIPASWRRSPTTCAPAAARLRRWCTTSTATTPRWWGRSIPRTWCCWLRASSATRTRGTPIPTRRS